TQASNFGKHTEVYNGVDVGISARFGRGGLLNGGVSTGRTVIDNCVVTDTPQLQFCKNTLPWAGQTQIKLNGAYPLPWNFQVSGVCQTLSGIGIWANRSFSTAEVAPTLGRNLSNCPTVTGPCTAAVTIALIEPNTMREDRLNQVDLRLTKTVKMGQKR